MSEKFTRRNVMLSLATAAAASQVWGTAAAEESEGHGIEQDGATLNRFAMSVIGAEITGMFITVDGRFFFNVQHPDANLDGTNEPGTIGAVTGVTMNQLPRDFESVQIPEGDDDDYGDGDGTPEPYDTKVRTALGDYQRLAVGGEPTDDGEELGSVYTPEGEVLTGQINPDFNGYVPSSEVADEGYLFTNWEVARVEVHWDRERSCPFTERIAVVGGNHRLSGEFFCERKSGLKHTDQSIPIRLPDELRL